MQQYRRGHAALFIGVSVKTHLGAVLAKSACRNRSEAIVLAYDAGLVTPGLDP